LPASTGDTLVVWKLDRLGRSVKGLVDSVNGLESHEVHFRSLADGIDTKTPKSPRMELLQAEP
jgi:DNA invertase Pin-like site-specific DNA recombinase